MTSFRLTPHSVRELTAFNLGYPMSMTIPLPTAAPISPWTALGAIDDDDPVLELTLGLLRRFGGVIFTGPPGTSKSWYAARIAIHLTGGGSPEQLRVVQFHPSYQYEDFVEGYVPTDTGFRREDKHLLILADHARQHPDLTHVLLIDELSRGEPGRIFGEALTYAEKSKRGFPFRLASGQEVTLPDNLVFLATMNPHDRGVDEVDAAFERRFAKIALDPDEGLLSTFLSRAAMEPALADRVVTFFRYVNKRVAPENPIAAIGHTYFIDAANTDDLRSVWDHQLRFHFDKAFRLDPDGLVEAKRQWDRVMAASQPEPTDSTDVGAA